MIAPYIPPIDPGNASDTQNFDDTFLDMEPVIDNEPEQTDSERDRTDNGTDPEESVHMCLHRRAAHPSMHPLRTHLIYSMAIHLKGGIPC